MSRSRRKARHETATVRYLGGNGHHGFVLCDCGGSHRRQRDAARREPPQRLRRGTGPAPGRPDRHRQRDLLPVARAQVGDAGFFLAFPEGLPGKRHRTRLRASKATPALTASKNTRWSRRRCPSAAAGTAADPLKQVTTYTVPSALARHPDDHLRERRPGVPGALGRQQQLRSARSSSRRSPPPTSSSRATTPAPGSSPPGRPASSAARTSTPGTSGGFVEVIGGGIEPWSAYQALRYGSASDEVWGKIEGSASSIHARPSTTRSSPKPPTTPAGSSGTRTRPAPGSPPARPAPSRLVVRSGVPSALQLNPTNGSSRQGVPINITATAVDSNGQPYAGKTLRYSIAGPNAATGAATLDARPAPRSSPIPAPKPVPTR